MNKTEKKIVASFLKYEIHQFRKFVETYRISPSRADEIVKKLEGTSGNVNTSMMDDVLDRRPIFHHSV